MPEQQEFSTIGLPMEVQDAMRNHLPQMMNKMLRDELAKGEAAIKEVIILRKDIQKVEKRLDEFGTIKRERATWKREKEELQKLQGKLAEESRLLSVERLQFKLLTMEKYSERLEATLAGLVRNTDWRKNVLNTDIKCSTNGSGGYSEERTPIETSEEAK